MMTLKTGKETRAQIMMVVEGSEKGIEKGGNIQEKVTIMTVPRQRQSMAGT